MPCNFWNLLGVQLRDQYIKFSALEGDICRVVGSDSRYSKDTVDVEIQLDISANVK